MTRNISAEECGGCCIGMPCYGENVSVDRVILDDVKRILYAAMQETSESRGANKCLTIEDGDYWV